MILGLIYKNAIVCETEFEFNGQLSQMIDVCLDRLGVNLSQYSISDMKQDGVGRRLDFFLKEEDYIKLRDDKINKILSE